MKRILILFLFVVSVLSAGENLKVDLQGKLVNYKFNYKENSSFMPVSITPYNDKYHLVANYTNVFLLNIENGDVYKFNLINDVYKFISENNSDSKILDVSNLTFVPTGLFYSSKYEKLYIANYKGNNILIFDVDINTKNLIYQGEIKTSNTIGPENVYVTDDGKYLASANYDGSDVTLFELTSFKQYKEIWSTEIGQAHGVTIKDSFVYATGLTERKVYKLDIRDGKIVDSIGNIDSNPSNNGFLWPTSINGLDENRLVVSDAHTGYIYILNKNNLKIESYFGGNSLSYKYLHMPYTVIVNDNKYYITSTFQDRIIVGNIKNWNAERSFVFSGRNWGIIKNQEIDSFIAKYDIYNYKNGPQIDFFTKRYTMGFGHIYPVDNDMPLMRLPDISTINNDSAYFYFTDLLAFKDSHIVFSPQSQAALYIKNSKGINYLIPFKLDSTDYWKYNNSLVNSVGKFDLNLISERINSKIIEIEKKRHSNGLLDLKDFYKIYNNENRPFLSYSLDEFNKRFELVFKTNEGKVFLDEYRKITKIDSKNDVEKIAFNYYKEALKNSYIDMNEFFIVQMLTGFNNIEKLFHKEKYVFEKCENANYYDGYDPKVLETLSLNDYVSAYSIDDSCFLVKNNTLPNKFLLGVIWYDFEHYAIDFEIYGITKENKEVLLLTIKDNKPIDTNGFATNSFEINSNKEIKEIKFVLKKASKQDRLLMREFTISEVSDNKKKIKETNELSLEELKELNKKVHTTIKYGNGKDFGIEQLNGKDYAELIKSFGNGHCGHYTYLLMREITANNQWRGYDIKTIDNRIHSVIEVNINNKWITFDPTLGIYYNKSVHSLINDDIKKMSFDVCKEVSSSFKGYCGESFFKAIKEFKMYYSFEGYEHNKLTKNNILQGVSVGEIEGYDTTKLYDEDRNSYFSSNGNSLEFKLKKLQSYRIELESYRYYDEIQNKEIILSPKSIKVELFKNDKIIDTYELEILEAKLLNKIYFNETLEIDKIKLTINGMHNTNSIFILRSIKLF